MYTQFFSKWVKKIKYTKKKKNHNNNMNELKIKLYVGQIFEMRKFNYVIKLEREHILIMIIFDVASLLSSRWFVINHN